MLKGVLIFIGGATIGSVVTYLATKSANEKYINSEIAAMREYYDEKHRELEAIKENKNAANNIISENKYTGYSSIGDLTATNPSTVKVDAVFDNESDDDEESDDEDEDDPDKEFFAYYDIPVEERNPNPYVITPTSFGMECPYYDKVTLVFHEEDGIITEEDGTMVTDVDKLVGWASLDRFGEYEPNVVYVRNEKICTDYEIVREYGTDD